MSSCGCFRSIDRRFGGFKSNFCRGLHRRMAGVLLTVFAKGSAEEEIL
ncbi:MAG: hypothetical protein NC400_07875 [Clostridium sp.]|nr:hypothetical protein [Clostridium sp.]